MRASLQVRLHTERLVIGRFAPLASHALRLPLQVDAASAGSPWRLFQTTANFALKFEFNNFKLKLTPSPPGIAASTSAYGRSPSATSSFLHTANSTGAPLPSPRAAAKRTFAKPQSKLDIFAPGDPATRLSSNKRFIVNGGVTPLVASESFVLEQAVTAEVVKEAESGCKLVLSGPRGSGKSTTVLHATQELWRRGLQPFVLDMTVVNKRKGVDSFWRSLSHNMADQAANMQLTLPPFDSLASFCTALSQASRAASGFIRRLVLLVDEFERLDESPEIKEELRLAMARVCTSGSESVIHSVVIVQQTYEEVGDFPQPRTAFWSVSQVASVLEEFAIARGVMLDTAIATQVFELTAGHAALVCACGRLLQNGIANGDLDEEYITASAWSEYEQQHRRSIGRDWAATRDLASAIGDLGAKQRSYLLRAAADSIDRQGGILDAGGEDADLEALVRAGWLIRAPAPVHGTRHRVSSPLLGLIARQAVLSAISPKGAGLLSAAGPLDVHSLFAALLPAMSSSVMRTAHTVTKKASRATLPGVGGRLDVPGEAAYQCEIASVLVGWLRDADELHVRTMVDAPPPKAGGASAVPNKRLNKKLDIMLTSRVGKNMHIFEFVASARDGIVREHFERTLLYKSALQPLGTSACVAFTALRVVGQVKADLTGELFRKLPWPTDEQLSQGLVAVHVVHDLTWTVAAVFCKRAGSPVTCEQVDLSY